MGFFDFLTNPKKAHRELTKPILKPIAETFDNATDYLINVMQGKTLLEFNPVPQRFVHQDLEDDLYNEFIRGGGLDDCVYILGNHMNHVAKLTQKEYEGIKKHP